MDSEIQIVITAVDEMSDKIDKIEGKLDDMSTTTERSSKSMANSFEMTVQGLVSIGNIVNATNNIFQTYENMQIKLENAQDRVANSKDNLTNAELRLKRAKEDLITTIHDEKRTDEDMIRAEENIDIAQRGVEKSTNNLEIAQRRLEKTQHDVWITYVNMGVQIGGLLLSIPTAIVAIGKLSAGFYGMAAATWAATAPLLIYLGIAIAVAAAIYDIIWAEQKLMEILSGGRIKAPKFGSKEVITDFVPNLKTAVGDRSGEKLKVNGNAGTPLKVVGDFISRPGMPIQEFSPDDTIIGTKSGSGQNLTINITGPIYGTNPKEISRALSKELFNKISI